MGAFSLSIYVEIKKNGMPFYNEIQQSFGLDDDQLNEMEKDLWQLKKKWAKATGIE